MIAFALILGLGSLAASSAFAGIVHPVNGMAYQTSPVDFRGDASLNFLTYSPQIQIGLDYVQQSYVGGDHGGYVQNTYETHTGTGTGSDYLDIDGDWNVHMADITDRSGVGLPGWTSGDPNPPDGTPLHDGKYHIEAFQLNHANGNPFDRADPNHNRWVHVFRIDSVKPDTVIDTATPPAPTFATTRSFTFHADDPMPSSGTYLDCRVDGGEWEHCDDPDSDFVPWADSVTPKATGLYTTPALGEGSHVFEVRARDGAAWEDPTPATSTWAIDLTKPNITIDKPAKRERFTLDQHVPADFTCEDPLAGTPPVASGIDTCEGPATVDTSKLGNFTYTVEATDHAGNVHSVTHSYAVDPPRYQDVIGSNHPIAYYRVNEPIGANGMLDSSGNHNNGEYKNNISLRQPPAPSCHVRPHAPYTCDLNADPQDFAANFPERDGYGFTNNIVAPKNAYTIEGWIKRFDHNAGSIMGQGGAGQLFVGNDGKLALRQTQDTVYTEGPVLTPNVWWHVAATWDGHNTRLYVNGTMVGFSSHANKPPSGISTLYVGYGDQAPWWHGSLDEMAYYGSALSGGAIRKRYVVGTAKDVPSPAPDGPPIQRPSADIHGVANGGLYAPTKVPNLLFHCEDLDGAHTVASCTATVDGNPINDGDALPDTPGEHTVVVTAIDSTELMRSHTHKYTVKSFEDIYNQDAPVVYYRLGDANNGPMKDSGPNHKDGIYKNAQQSGGIGISGDLDRARRFFGESGYGYANNITAPTFQSTLEAWVNPDDHRQQSIVGHGDAGELFIGEDGTLNYRRMGVTVTTSPGALPGRFTHVVGVWDGTYNYLYVDGELRGKAESTKRPSSSSTFYVGYGEIRPWFKGSLDEVAYYGKALTAGRVLEHFLADPPPPADTMDPDDSVSDEPSDPSDPPADPDTPVDNGPDTDEPSTDPSDDPSVEPINEEVDDPSITQNGSGKVFKGKGKSKKAQLRKCKKIKNVKKRKNCTKRVRTR